MLKGPRRIPTPPRAVRAAIFVVVLLVSTAAQCTVVPPNPTPPAYTGNVEGRKVVIIGDSITDMATPQLTAAFSTDYTVSVKGLKGYTVGQMQPTAELMADMDPDIAIINLGTNDWDKDVPLATSLADLEAMIATFSMADCIFVTTTTELGADPGSAPYNEMLRETIVPGAANRRLIEWAQVLSYQRDYAQGLLTWDTIHPTAEGSDHLFTTLLANVRRCDEPSSIAVEVYDDLDGSGTRDAGEPGLDTATVSLLADIDELPAYEPQTIDAAVDANGAVPFADLPPGEFVVRVEPSSLPTGYVGTANLSRRVTLGRSENATIQIGAHDSAGAVGGTVFQEPTETGVRGHAFPAPTEATITLSEDTDWDGTFEHLVTTVVTTTGDWVVDDLPAGVYQATVANPADGVSVLPSTPTSKPIVISDGEVNRDIDFGYYHPMGMISVTIFDDVDADSVRDPGEPGVPYVNVDLLQDRDLDGSYEYTVGRYRAMGTGGIPMLYRWWTGNYRLSIVVPPGRVLTTPPTFDRSLTVGGTVAGSFGLHTVPVTTTAPPTTSAPSSTTTV